MNKSIEIVHASEVEPALLVSHVKDFDRAHRYQSIAIDREVEVGAVVGYWRYMPRPSQSGAVVWLDSHHTRVANAYRRQGIAVELWRHAVARWKPARIDVSCATYEGCALVAHMACVFAGVTRVELGGSEWRDTFNRKVAAGALRMLADERNIAATEERARARAARETPTDLSVVR